MGLHIVDKALNHCFKNAGNIVSATKCFLICWETFFFLRSKFFSETKFPEVGQHENIDRKNVVSATMFPSLPRVLQTQDRDFDFT